MLPKTSRISRKEFPKGSGRRTPFPFGSILFGVASTPVFAVVVSKKFVPKATERNALRRRVYSVIRKITPHSPRSAVIYLDRKARTATFQELESGLKKVLQK